MTLHRSDACWAVTRDGDTIPGGIVRTEADALALLHRTCPTSWQHAIEHEGYRVTQLHGELGAVLHGSLAERWQHGPGKPYVRAELALCWLAGNERPYFSATGTIWQSRGWWENGDEARAHGGGCLHDELLRLFPSTAGPVVRVHLADDDGKPLHAVANAWYWLEQGKLSMAASTLRVEVEDLPELAAGKQGVRELADALADRWQSEADEAVAAILRAAWGSGNG